MPDYPPPPMPGPPPPPSFPPPGAAGSQAPTGLNGYATASLVVGVVGLVVPLAAIVAIVCGHVALSQLNRTEQDGRNMAVGGTVLGYVGFVYTVVFWLREGL